MPIRLICYDLLIYSYAVHGGPLLGAIRVCFNIALTRYLQYVVLNCLILWFIHHPVLILTGMFSKSPINQATSRATLTQMLSIIFGQMENDVVWNKSSSRLLQNLSHDAEVVRVFIHDGINTSCSFRHLLNLLKPRTGQTWLQKCHSVIMMIPLYLWNIQIVHLCLLKKFRVF